MLYLPRLALLGLLLVQAACTSNVKKFSDVVAIDQADDLTLVAVQANAKLVDYTFSKLQHRVESIHCSGKADPERTGQLALVINRPKRGLNPDNFCTGWIAQAFLRQGFEVYGLNLPGYGRSSGQKDFAGDQSLQALQAWHRSISEPGLAVGWAMEEHTIALARFAKQGDMDWLIMGNGIYDAEMTLSLTQDTALKGTLQRLIEQHGEMAIEKRSIAWDFGGLAKIVTLYHGRQNQRIPLRQAKEFRDSLNASEISTDLLVLEQQGAGIPEDVHLNLLNQILTKKKMP